MKFLMIRYNIFWGTATQPAFTSSKSIMETPEYEVIDAVTVFLFVDFAQISFTDLMLPLLTLTK